MALAKRIADEVFTKSRILDAFAVCGIEPFAPERTMERIQNDQKPKKEVSDERLREILAPTVIIQKVEPKKRKKRISLSNKVVTSDVIMEDIKKRKRP